MPSELVLLSDCPPPTAVLADQGLELDPDAVLVDFAVGIRQLLSPAGYPIATVFPSIELAESAMAEAAVDGGTAGLGWWTDVTIPYGDATEGRQYLQAVAQAIGGIVRDRT